MARTSLAHALLLSTAARPRDFYFDEHARIMRCVALDAFKVHAITDDPDVADVIIFFEPDDTLLASDVRSHPYAKRYPDKVFVFDPSDRIVPFLPGIYASVRRGQYDACRVRSGFFPVVLDHDWITCDDREPDLLCSFMGDIRGIPVREAIAALQHPRIVVRDTGDDPANVDGREPASYDRFHREFGEVMSRSAFVLCPAGAGASTFRLFETMKAGRVPVILSDEWVRPEGPAWAEFSLVVAERDVRALPGILEAHRAAAAAMGKRARVEWEQWFGETSVFHRIVESCLSIQRSRRRPERLMRALVLAQLLEPFNLRYKLLPALRRRGRQLLARRARP